MQNTENTAINENTALVDEVKEKLLKLKLSTSWAAEMLGYTTEYLRKLLTGKIKATTRILAALELFKCKLEQMEKILLAA